MTHTLHISLDSHLNTMNNNHSLDFLWSLAAIAGAALTVTIILITQ